MSILTPTEVAAFLGIEADEPGLQEAIDQAEALVAGKMNLSTLELTAYGNESRLIGYTTQQIITKHAPIREITAFEYDGEDALSDVVISAGGWSIRWAEPFIIDFDRVKSFDRMKRVTYSYTAGWTGYEDSYPLPTQVAEYVKSMTGIVLGNLLASGVYDTKLGDMTIKIQRETLERNLMVYDNALRMHARP
jgi:hypothetical protein